MKVFLTGATGYIGGAVAQALAAAGHEVVGLARSDRAEQELRRRGVIPVRGDLTKPSDLTSLAQRADGAIHTGFSIGPDGGAIDRASVEAILAGLNGSGKPFVYTSGVWVFGNTGPQPVDETSPLDPTPLVAWRPAVEQLVFDAAAHGVRSVVIRPGDVYGRGGGMIADMVAQGREKGTVSYVGDGENHWPVIHVDDLARLYVLALEKAPAGTLLHATVGSSVRLKDIADAASRAAGVAGKTASWPLAQARKALGPFADALALDQHFASSRASDLLGWTPREPSLLADVTQGSYLS
jgi:nucleoside-diphosphate-sugar epimerase